MKKILFALVIIQTSLIILVPSAAKSQEGLYKRHWVCCLCQKLFKEENLKPQQRQNMGRKADTMCPDCEQKLGGDLNKAFEQRKQRNAALMARYRLKERDANLANEKMVDAMEKTFGQDASSGSYTGSGVDSKAGKFTTAFASLVTNFETGGIIPKFTKYTANGLSIYQSGGGAEMFGNVSSSFIDVITEQAINSLFLPGNPLNGPGRQLFNDFKAGKSLDAAVANFNKTLSNLGSIDRAKTELKVAEGLSIIADIFGLYDATKEFFSGLADVIDNYNIRELNEKDRLKLMDEIAGNSDTMACIKSTIDDRNNGTGYLRKPLSPTNHFTPLSLSLFVSTIHWENLIAGLNVENSGFLEVDIYRLTAMKKQLEQLLSILEVQLKNYLFEIIPPLDPWILGKWAELKSPTLNLLLKRLKPALTSAVSNFKKIEAVNAYINDNVAYIVTGNEINYTSGSPDIISSLQKLGGDDLKQKWIQQSNDKIKNDLGRVIMKFPPGSEWSIDFYTAEGKYYTNRSSYSNHPALYDLPPGNYNISLNHVLVPNVPIEKGKEFVFRFGFLDLLTHTSWYLYTESKEKALTSGNRPMKMPLPVGSYVLNFEGKDYEIIIRDRMTLKFEPRVSEFLDK
jgi:hypothetical protein